MNQHFDGPFVQAWMDRAADLLTEACPYLTELDSARGDADHGVNMRDGFTRIADELHRGEWPHGADALAAGAGVLRRTMGGTSGALWAAALRRAGKYSASADGADAVAGALRGLADAVEDLGGASVGDNTMLDALRPAADAYTAGLLEGASASGALEAALAAAEAGALRTANTVARKGRASYVGERGLGTPDPGATSAAIVVAALKDAATTRWV